MSDKEKSDLVENDSVPKVNLACGKAVKKLLNDATSSTIDSSSSFITVIEVGASCSKCTTAQLSDFNADSNSSESVHVKGLAKLDSCEHVLNDDNSISQGRDFHNEIIPETNSENSLVSHRIQYSDNKPSNISLNRLVTLDKSSLTDIDDIMSVPVAVTPLPKSPMSLSRFNCPPLKVTPGLPLPTDILSSPIVSSVALTSILAPISSSGTIPSPSVSYLNLSEIRPAQPSVPSYPLFHSLRQFLDRIPRYISAKVADSSS